MKTLAGGVCVLALGAVYAVAGAGSGTSSGVMSAVSSGIPLVSAATSEPSSGVVFDARWRTTAASNADLVDKTFGVLLIVR